MSPMPLDRESGCATPGTDGAATHLGDPLTVDEIRALPDGSEVVITWCGGNGPNPYRILVDQWGGRRVDTCYADLILKYADQEIPFHRVTLGWDDETRVWAEGKLPEPEHILAHWRWLRGEEGQVDA